MNIGEMIDEMAHEATDWFEKNKTGGDGSGESLACRFEESIGRFKKSCDVSFDFSKTIGNEKIRVAANRFLWIDCRTDDEEDPIDCTLRIGVDSATGMPVVKVYSAGSVELPMVNFNGRLNCKEKEEI